jgi:hypothetical protein
MKKLILLVTLFFIQSCNVENSKKYQDLKDENSRLQILIDSLSETSENKYLNANKYFEDKNYELAIKEFENYVKLYKDSPYYNKANQKLKVSKIQLKKIKLEAERKASLKFKSYSEKQTVKIKSLTLKTFGYNFTNQFDFDRYDDRYHYRESERGNKYLSFDVVISSEDKDPSLPLFYIYVLDAGNLTLISSSRGMDYEFYEWEDYGSYLGNDADYSNDFSRTKSIRFDIGEEVKVSDYKGKKVYLLMSKNNTAYRSTRIGNPEIYYTTLSSMDSPPKTITTTETFDKHFILIKRL